MTVSGSPEEPDRDEPPAGSDRNDPPVRDWQNVYCDEVGTNEAIVGICFNGRFIANPNRCAENYRKPSSCRCVC